MLPRNLIVFFFWPDGGVFSWCFILVVCSLDLVYLVLFCTPFVVSCTKSWHLNMRRIRVLKGA